MHDSTRDLAGICLGTALLAVACARAPGGAPGEVAGGAATSPGSPGGEVRAGAAGCAPTARASGVVAPRGGADPRGADEPTGGEGACASVSRGPSSAAGGLAGARGAGAAPGGGAGSTVSEVGCAGGDGAAADTEVVGGAGGAGSPSVAPVAATGASAAQAAGCAGAGAASDPDPGGATSVSVTEAAASAGWGGRGGVAPVGGALPTASSNGAAAGAAPEPPSGAGAAGAPPAAWAAGTAGDGAFGGAGAGGAVADGGAAGDGGALGASGRCASRAPEGSPAGRCWVVPGSAARLIAADLVTPDEVLEDAELLIGADGRIACVGCDCGALDPQATRVHCPGAVAAPGLINAHDHAGWMNGAPFDASDFVDLDGAPIVADPATRFEHRNDWREAGNPRLPKIAAPGGGATLAAKTYGELRFALGGATTTFASSRLTGILRDVDDTSYTDERTRNVDGHAYTTYETFPLGASAQATAGCGAYTLRGPVGSYPWVPHVAEGIDDSARNEFLCLSGLVPGGFDVLDDRTALIHGVALLPRDLAHLGRVGAKLVWSPRSNLALYGDTARVAEADRLGVTIGLGTDWLPSGSMHVLRELACADEFNRDRLGGYFDDAALVGMATSGAAEALGYDDVLGRLAVGLAGDVALFARHDRSPHRAVLEATEGDVLLVLRGGQPTVGDADLVAALAPDCDLLGDVCGVQKRACVARDTGQTLDEILGAVGEDAYPLFACGAPPGEPTCVPSRSLPGASIDGLSTLYAGWSSLDDPDGDGLAGALDRCPTVFDPVRPLDHGVPADADGDGVGDACDPCPLAPDLETCAGDQDGDGVPDGQDRCPYDPDPTAADADGDGWGDACDACPGAPNPGTTPCPPPPASIATLWQLGDGIDATLDGVCVIAAKPPSRLWVQDPAPTTDAVSAGLFVYVGNASYAGAVGDRVRVSGRTSTYQGAFELVEPTVTVLEAAAPECADAALAVAVDAADVQPGSPTELRYRFMLVRLTGAEVTAVDGAGAALVVDGGLGVTAYLAGFDPAVYPVGTRFALLQGVVDFYGQSQLAPRGPGDLLVE